MRFFGYPYNHNDLVICKDSPDYLGKPTELTLNQTDNYCIAYSVVGITFYLSNFIILI